MLTPAWFLSAAGTAASAAARCACDPADPIGRLADGYVHNTVIEHIGRDMKGGDLPPVAILDQRACPAAMQVEFRTVRQPVVLVHVAQGSRRCVAE